MRQGYWQKKEDNDTHRKKGTKTLTKGGQRYSQKKGNTNTHRKKGTGILTEKGTRLLIEEKEQ